MKYLICQYHHNSPTTAEMKAEMDYNTDVHDSMGRDGYADYYKLSVKSVSAYAKKYKHDYQLFDVLDKSIGENYFYGLFYPFKNQLVDSYDGVCFIDTDILITKNAPNIFRHMHSDKLSGYFRRWNSDELKSVDPKKIRSIKILPTGKINTGVLLIPKAMYSVMRDIKLTSANKGIGYYGSHDEGIINKYIRENGQFSPMPRKFNHVVTPEYFTDNRLNSFFIHYCWDAKRKMSDDFHTEIIIK